MSSIDQSNTLDVPCKDRSIFVIAGGVIAGHFLLLLWSILVHSETKPFLPVSQRRLVVQTVALNPAKHTPEKAIVIAPPPPTPIVKEETQIVKEETKIEKAEEITQEPVIEKIDKEIASIPTPKDPPILPVEEPIPVIKDEPAPIAKDPAPKPVQITKTPPPKKPEIKKKAEEKPVVKKAPPKPIAQKNEPQKIAAIKPPEKKSPPPSSSPAPTPQPKKAEIDKAAIERQKKIEAEQKEAKIKQQKLLSQAQEMIAKIDKSRDKVNRTDFSEGQMTSPKAIANLQSDTIQNYSGPQMSSQEASYRDELVERLKLKLKLPEYGEVKIKLTLERSGKVANVIIERAASQANRKYVEKMLPGLTFPSFGTNFNQSSQYTFLITLCNDL